jgi:restriction endonuclease Mrr
MIALGGFMMVRRRRSQQKVASSPLVPQPAGIQLFPVQPSVPPQAPQIQAVPEQRQEVIAQLLETFRHGDPTQRQQALIALIKMGEVEEF